MLADLTLLISACSLVISIIVAWAYAGISHQYRQAINKLETRMRYLEMAADYRNLVPLPWEEKGYHEVNNIIYLEEKQ